MHNLLRFYFVALAYMVVVYGVSAQKQPYVPAYIRDTNTIEGKQFSWTKTHQSANFLLIWGDSSGVDPTKASSPDLRFDPRIVLDTLEYIHARCAELGMLSSAKDSKANRHKYVVVMYGTYGPDGPQGWANGWAVDDSIGAFWVHPNATRDGKVMAHEFTHSLQAMYHIDGLNPFRGAMAIFDNIGLFYETHANYVRNVIYPEAVSSDIDAHHVLMLEPDWKFNYEGYHVLFHIHESFGMDMVSRLWTEWRPEEFPLQTLRRISGLDQRAFNDTLYSYARKAVTWDYATNDWGRYLRRSRDERLRAPWGRIFAQRTFDVLLPLDTASERYYTPEYLAPQDYGYNVVRLYPKDRSLPIGVSFIGHTEVNDHAGWRYGFVTVSNNGSVIRYDAPHEQPRSSLEISLRSDEAALYLVVMGAPADTMHAVRDVHTTWNGNPKRFHYPWEVRLVNARPEGYQDPALVRPWLRSGDGAPHPNGGGWVSAASSVEPTVYVGPRATVAGRSTITGRVRIDGCAYVEDARISDDAVVTENAFVIGGTLSERAVVRGQCIASNNTVRGMAILGGASIVQNYELGGTVRVDGDLVVYNEEGACDTGEYHVLTQYYRNDLLPCDGRDSLHPQNVSVNRPMIFDVLSVDDDLDRSVAARPNPVSGSWVEIEVGSETGLVQRRVLDVFGRCVQSSTDPASHPVRIDVTDLPPGAYTVVLTGVSGRRITARFVRQ